MNIYLVIIYPKYHKMHFYKMICMWLRVEWGVLAYTWHHKSRCPYGEKWIKSEQISRISFSRQTRHTFVFYASFALPDFVIFKTFTSILTLFQYLEMGITPLGHKFELSIEEEDSTCSPR